MKTPILCYHKVGTEDDEGRRLNISPKRLDSHVRYFKRRNYRFISLHGDDIEVFKPRGVCFTFDDAYTSALVNGCPIFQRHSVRCSFYAVTSLVGQTSIWDGGAARPLATWDQLLAAYGEGFGIGNHTHTHPRLSTLNAEDQISEVEAAKNELESRGIVHRTFCYPYGDLNDAARVAVRNLYPIGLALGKRQAVKADASEALPRIVVAFSDALPKLLYKLHIRPLLP